MSDTKLLFPFVFALCILPAVGKLVYGKVGQTIKIECGVKCTNKDVEWKHKDLMIVRVSGRSGTTRAGNAPISARAKVKGDALEISTLENGDIGRYSCIVNKQEHQHSLYIVTVDVRPSTVQFQGSNATLRCQVKWEGSTPHIGWLKPGEKEESEPVPGSERQLDHVTISDNGEWKCKITQDGETHLESQTLNVIGILPKTQTVSVREGDSVLLPCSLSSSSNLLNQGGWGRLPPGIPPIHFPTLKGGAGLSLLWDGSLIKGKPKVVFSSEEKLHTNFSVTLKKAHAGVYVCSLTFGSHGTLKAQVTVKVGGSGISGVPCHDCNSVSLVPGAGMSVLGLNLWVWVAVVAGCLVLVLLVVTVTLLHRRNKRMKRRARKLRPVTQPLKSTEFCQCDRTPVAPPPRGRPHPRPREKPPAVAKQQR